MTHNRKLFPAYCADKGKKICVRINRYSDWKGTNEHAEHFFFSL